MWAAKFNDLRLHHIVLIESPIDLSLVDASSSKDNPQE